MATTLLDIPGARSIRIGASRVPVLLPSIRDSRLHVAAVIFSLHALGQAFLGFELSIPQIAVSLATCGIIEVGIVLWRDRVLAWPASALLTGNGVAFILRVDGTRHGDWWSTRGLHLFAATAALSLLSKYVIRWRGQQVFNPSNLGLVVCFLVVGTQVVNPLDFWWAPMGPAMAAAYAVILVGGLVIGRRQGTLGMSIAFWVAFAGMLAVLSASGHCMRARWSVGPVCGGSFWTNVAFSPEVLIFLFFMITDPHASPRSPVIRRWFGAFVGVVAALLLAPQQTEFASKVAVLGSLVLVCALRAVLATAVMEGLTARLGEWFLSGRRRTVAIGLGCFVPLAAVMVPIGAATTLEPAPAAAAEVLDAPPIVDVPFEVPRVRLGDTVTSIYLELDAERAQAIGQDVAEDLVAEQQALREGQTGLASRAVTGERLAALVERVSAGERAVDVRISALRLVLVRDPANPQATPALAIEVDGRPAGTYLVEAMDGRYVIAGTA